MSLRRNGIGITAGVLAACAVILVPTYANAHHHHHSGSFVGGLVAGAVLGAAVDSMESHPREKYYYVYPPAQPVYYPPPQPCGYYPYPPCVMPR